MTTAAQFDIPGLPPDLTFARMPAREAEIAFSYRVKRAALGPHVASRWGWDDAFQAEVHRRRFSERPFYSIRLNGRPIGTLSLENKGDHIRFGEFYLLPSQHGRGLGTRILAHCLAMADELGLPIRLEHLHWNPVGSLYRRYGFALTGTTQTHCFLERPVGASANQTTGRASTRPK